MVAWLGRRSLLAFAAASLVLVAIKLLFDLYPGDFPVKGQAKAFSWPLVGGVILIGVLGLLADRSLRLPQAFADMKRERRGLAVAAVAGLAYGLITIAQDRLAPGAGNPLTPAEWPHVPWPWAPPRA